MNFGFPVITESVREDVRGPVEIGSGISAVEARKSPAAGECPLCYGQLYTRAALGRVVGIIQRYKAGGTAVYCDPAPENMEAVVCGDCRVCFWRPKTQA